MTVSEVRGFEPFKRAITEKYRGAELHDHFLAEEADLQIELGALLDDGGHAGFA